MRIQNDRSPTHGWASYDDDIDTSEYRKTKMSKRIVVEGVEVKELW